MAEPLSQPRSSSFLTLAGLALLVLGALGGWAFERQRMAGAVSGSGRAAMEKVVHDYLLAHPEILPEAMDRLRAKESQKQLAGIGSRLYEAYPGAIMGNPQGKVTLVAFSDFACTYCRQSEPALAALIAENPDLKVVIRHLPIIAPTSPVAAAMGLAAAEQGKYGVFHSAMFAAGRTDPPRSKQQRGSPGSISPGPARQQFSPRCRPNWKPTSASPGRWASTAPRSG